ncbi:hypothetical protein L1987_02097 [Smallanthus sonchifolius]|uniref:Uncharacterized protein n=1 Tax=Smallanthus sonchifolius TaxID=185202 RepID=A0ACB9K6V7_9ASTR|nr:hypothetical protein L1987_02097 [Smallanthus sonchifolius]
MGSSGARAGFGICEVKVGDPIQVMEAPVDPLPVERRRRGRRDDGVNGGLALVPGADGFPEIKITDKIRLKKNHQPWANFFIKSQTIQSEANDYDQIEESGIVKEKPAAALLKSPATENELPEETVFWLMDRFAPC